MRLPVGTVVAAIVATISTTLPQYAFADDVDFDPQRALQGRMVDQATDAAETCIHEDRRDHGLGNLEAPASLAFPEEQCGEHGPG